MDTALRRQYNALQAMIDEKEREFYPFESWMYLDDSILQRLFPNQYYHSARALKAALVNQAGCLSELIHKSLPQLQPNLGSSSSGSKKPQALTCSVVTSTFLCLEDIQFMNLNKSSAICNGGDRCYRSEFDIQLLVVLVLHDMITLTGKQLKILNKIVYVPNTDQKRPDTWLLYLSGFPVGLCEVKVPKAELKNCADQIYDYLQTVQNILGLKYLFCLFTTYENWAVCWIDMPEQILSCRNISDLDTDSELYKIINQNQTQQTTQQSNQRVLKCSNLYSFNSPDIVKFLCSVVHKMCFAAQFIIHPANRLYMRYTETSCGFEKLPSYTLSTAWFTGKATIGHIYLLQQFEGGMEAFTWKALAVNYSIGYECVVKMSEDEESINKEHKVWEAVVNSDVNYRKSRRAFFVKYGMRYCLVMPLLQACKKDDIISVNGGVLTHIKNPQEWEAIKAAIYLLALSGYKHEDLHWRHIGFASWDKDIKKAYLFDFENTTKIQKQDIDGTAREMIQDLILKS